MSDLHHQRRLATAAARVLRPAQPAPGFHLSALTLALAAALASLSALPLPANARQITGTSYECPGELHATSAFYRAAMQDRGYRLVADDAHAQGVRLHFARDDQRVEIRLQPVLGGMPTVRMIVVATAPT